MDGLEDWFVQPENHTEVDQSAARVSTPPAGAGCDEGLFYYDEYSGT